jgi:hypothetical protein
MSPALTSQSMAASSKPCEPGRLMIMSQAIATRGSRALLRWLAVDSRFRVQRARHDGSELLIFVRPNARDNAVQLSQRVGREGGSRHLA